MSLTGLAASVLLAVWGIKNGVFTSQQMMEESVAGIGIMGSHLCGTGCRPNAEFQSCRGTAEGNLPGGGIFAGGMIFYILFNSGKNFV